MKTITELPDGKGENRFSNRPLYYGDTTHTVYVEPFFWWRGGAVLLKIDRTSHSLPWKPCKRSKQATDHHLWRVRSSLKSWLRMDWKIQRLTAKKSIGKHERFITIHRSTARRLKVAWAVYIECNMSFSNAIGGGWRAGVITQTKQQHG
jgi:hypothetical protein